MHTLRSSTLRLLARLGVSAALIGLALLVLPIANAGAETGINGIACISATNCVGAGTSNLSSPLTLPSRSQALTWNGKTWTDIATPEPSGAKESDLAGVSCSSASSCYEAGSYVDSGGVKKSLVISWNGSAWSVVSTPNPSGATSTVLTGISCPSSTSCVASGKYVDSGGATRAMSLTLASSVWSVNTPTISGSTASEFTTVSCTSSSNCMASGSSVSSGVRKALIMRWNGSAWSTQAVPSVEGAKESTLASVMCRLEIACMAVGSYVDSGGATKSLAVSWNGTSWKVLTTENPTGTSVRFNSVSCFEGVCEAAGEYTNTSGVKKPLVESWNGNAWGLRTFNPPSEATSSRFLAISCTSTERCEAGGSIAFGAQAPTGALAAEMTGPIAEQKWVQTYTAGHLSSPSYGFETAKWVSLKAVADVTGNTSVKFQYRELGGVWKDIPLANLYDSDGVALASQNVALSGGVSSTVTWDAPPTLQPTWSLPHYDFEVRSLFSGGSGGSSEPILGALDPRGLSSDDASEAIGPGSVDLVTGNFSVTETDASVKSWANTLAVSRTFNSRDPYANYPAGAFGAGWTLGIPDDVSSDYTMLEEKTEEWEEQVGQTYVGEECEEMEVGPEVFEEVCWPEYEPIFKTFTRTFVVVTTTEGEEIQFSFDNGKYVPETGFETLTLAKPSGTEFTLKDSGGSTIVFTQKAGSTIFVPTEIKQPPSANTSSIIYQIVNGKPRVSKVLGPVPAGVNCENLNTSGCRSLELVYSSSTTASGTAEANWGTLKDAVDHINFTAYDPGTAAMKTDTVAQYLYDNASLVRAEWDPRISPALKTRYGYDEKKRLIEVKPAGLNAWTMAYRFEAGDGSLGGRLASVSQSTPQGTATTTLAYHVPFTGGSAPYAMGSATVKTWGQTQPPVGATAIFPPDSVPSDPPSNYTRATLHYMDSSGREINTVGPGGWTNTTEYDGFGHIVRELTARNRERALAAGASSEAVSHTLDTQRVYQNNGTELAEELGPQHQVQLSSGSVVEARAQTLYAYNEGAPGGTIAHLPTKTTTQAKIVGNPTPADVLVTKTEYDWTLQQPVKVIRDYGGLNITEAWAYDSATGAETAHFPPNHPTTPSDHIVTYYKAGASGNCGFKPYWANLPCEVFNGSALGGDGLPPVPTKKFEYNRLNQQSKMTETVENRERVTTYTYDAAGRTTSSKISTSSDQEGLVAAYGFEESSGTSVADSSGNANNGTLENVTRISQGRFGRALDFDSSTDKVVIPDSNSLDVAGAITLEAWVRPDAIASASAQKIIEKGGSGTCASPAYGLYASTSTTATLPRAYACGSSVEKGSALRKGMWSHVAVTIDSAKTARFYVNGIETGSGTIGSLSQATTGQLLIGPGFDGQIDEVRVYNRQLSANEVRDDMISMVDSATPPPTPPAPLSGLVAGYGFEELASSTKVVDSSTQGNEGTVSTSLRTSGGHNGAGLSNTAWEPATVPDSNSLDLTTGITLEAWVAPKSLAAESSIVSKGGAYGLYALPSGWVKFSTAGKVASTFVSELAVGRADFVAGTYDGMTVKLYVNGVLRASASGSGSAEKNTSPLKIGMVQGDTDEVRVYNRALSQTELQQDSANAVIPAWSAASNGTKLPTATYGYDSNSGLPTTIAATSDGATRTITTGYDSVGRITSYQDADGNVSTTSYDIDSRPTQMSDGKGTQTFTYDSVTGLPTTLVDSQAGTFTATYNSDGEMVSEVYPNGMTAAVGVNETGTSTSLKYTKAGCPTCVWFEENVKESIHGQKLLREGTLSKQQYSYDGIGRLVLVKDTPVGSGCTTRSYTYDADSNRQSLITRVPNEKGDCVVSGEGTTQTSTYDGGDRIRSSGFTYDSFGRLTTVPASHSGGGPLTMSYYANSMVRSETQDGVTKGFLLDPTERRARASIPVGNEQEILHYEDAALTPAWSAQTIGGSVSTWQRFAKALNENVGAVVSFNGTSSTVALQMTDLGGNVIGTASTDPNATGPTELFETTEFGIPRKVSNRDLGWLGAKGIHTTLQSGVAQTGVRTYIPGMGRYTAPDPVFGGSANSYDYGNADPIDNSDLEGRATSPSCGYSICRYCAPRTTWTATVGRGTHASLVLETEWCAVWQRSQHRRVIRNLKYEAKPGSLQLGWELVGDTKLRRQWGSGHVTATITAQQNVKLCGPVPKIGIFCKGRNITVQVLLDADGISQLWGPATTGL